MSGPAKTGVEMRQQIAKSLNGVGVEFGAGTVDTAFPIPPGAKMLYADVNQQAELLDRNYFQGRELVVPDLNTGIEQMDGISPASLDFVIASHVIEHTRNPIRALHLAHEKLRTGGRFVLVVPDQEVTFDKTRPITTIEHLVADYLMPCRERDFEHYLEFFGRSFGQTDPVASAKGVWERGDDIHFHTWTFESFGSFVHYVIDRYVPWSSVWSYPRLSDNDNEFFYILTK
ncbi:MAG: class I SAM-dependent methyltransferase [Betaproteobacteria bacterium]